MAAISAAAFAASAHAYEPKVLVNGVEMPVCTSARTITPCVIASPQNMDDFRSEIASVQGQPEPGSDFPQAPPRPRPADFGG